MKVSILAFAVGVSVFSINESRAGSISDLRFLSGCWSGPVDGGAILQDYFSPVENKMVFGEDQAIQNGETLGWGTHIFEEKGSNVILHYFQGTTLYADFQMTGTVSNDQMLSATFKASSPGFESQVTFSATRGGALEINVMETRNGQPQSFTLKLHRDKSVANCRR